MLSTKMLSFVRCLTKSWAELIAHVSLCVAISREDEELIEVARMTGAFRSSYQSSDNTGSDSVNR
jgi:hypothetical protein